MFVVSIGDGIRILLEKKIFLELVVFANACYCVFIVFCCTSEVAQVDHRHIISYSLLIDSKKLKSVDQSINQF
jgi:hypothetical protein